MKVSSGLVRRVVPLALALVLPLQPASTQAATFDVPDGDAAALIAAITAANGTAEPNVINLAPGATYTLTAANNGGPGPAITDGATGLPIVTSRIVVNGNGATIERSGAPGTPDFRIFRVMAGGDLTLDRVTIRGGRGVNGGGLLNDIAATSRLLNSTVTDNGGAEGGGIFNFRGTLSIVNSTISHNVGFGLRTGGGILTFESVATTIVNSTIFENRADGPPGFQGRGDAIADGFSGPGTIVVKNSILASPTQGVGTDCFGLGAGVLTSFGHNIASDTSCVGLTASGDLPGTDPRLGPLDDHGGSTPTHAPLPGSPAVNAVPLVHCTDVDGDPVDTDQRGVARPQGAGCDAGAHEATAPANRPPVAGAGPDQTVEATSPSGAFVSLDGSGSSDPDGDHLTYGWSWPLGAAGGVSPVASFPPGRHTVTLTVDDGQATANDTVSIIVRDTTPPDTLLSVATDGNGSAVNGGGSTLSTSVTFTFSGSDAVGVAGFQCSLDGSAYAPCSSPRAYPALTRSRHVFRVRALDRAGNVDPSPVSLTWTVLTPAQAIQNLLTTIESMGLPRAVANSLSAPLERALELLNDHKPKNDTAVCQKLNAFMNRVAAKAKKGHLTPVQASRLSQAASGIRASLSC